MRTEDGHIIRKCLNGDSAAFGFLVDKYRESVYAFAYSRLRNFHDAEDVTQEVFIKAYQKLRSLKRWDNFLAWLYSMTSNLCKNWTRAQSRRPDREFVEDKSQKIIDMPSMYSHREKQAVESLQEALDSLPEVHRQVLTLHYLGGMTSKEIARFLGTSQMTVLQRLKRARLELKEEMLAMTNATFKEHKLPMGFTLRIVETVNRMKVNPIPRITGLPWGLSLTAGLILTILSLNPNISLHNPMNIMPNLDPPREMEVTEVGEIPADVLRVSQMPFISSSQGNGNGGESGLPDRQNAILMAPRGEGITIPEKPSARLGRGYVYETAYSPDGKLFAVATTFGIWLHDAENLNEVGLLEGLTYSVAFSPDGNILASGGSGGLILLWDVLGQKQIGELRGHTSAVISFAFSPDGRILASGSNWQDKTVRLWDVQEQKQIGLLVGHTGSIHSLAFSPDGKILASGSSFEEGEKEKEDKPIFLWDVAGQKRVGVLQGHTESVGSLAFSTDGKLLASGSGDTARLWDVQEQRQVRMSQGWIYDVYSGPDGRLLAIIFKDDTIRLWDIQEEKQLGILQKSVDSMTTNVILSPDGKILTSFDYVTTIQFWDVLEQKQAGSLQGYTLGVQSIAFSPDGKTLASHDNYRTISLWDVQAQKQVAALKEDSKYSGFQFVVFNPDGKTLASGGSTDNTIRLWDVQEQKQIGLLKGHTDGVWSLAFSPDGKILASGGGRGGDSTIRLWDVQEQKEIKVLRGHSAHVHSLTFSPDGELLASGAGIDNTVRLWDTQGWNLVDVLQHPRVVMSIAFSPDSKILATGDYFGTVRLWDIRGEPKLLISMGGHTDCARSLSFSPDGEWLASGSWDSTVRIWDVAEQAEVAVLKEHTSSVYSVAFSPDGRWLASGGGDSKILLWEVNIPVQGKAVESAGKLPGTWGEVKKTTLYQNFPNPFNPETWIPFSLSDSEHVIIKIYSSKGGLVRTLDLGQKPSGAYLSKDKAAYWDGRNEMGETVASDVYFYVMEAGETTDLMKMVMVR